MKFTYIVFALFVAGTTAIPLFQSEDVGEEFVGEEFGEEFIPKDNEEDWQLVPDSDGKLHLVDINSVNFEAEPLFVGLADIIFRLFTRPNTATAQIVGINNNAQLAASNFVASRQTRFHVHGWNGGGANTGANIRTAYLNQLDCNVFVVDWGAGAQTPNYILARNRVNEVGTVVAQYINWINSQGTPWANIVAVGHSLGAHVVGAAGKRTNANIAAVVGLDPAGPLFSVDDPANRLHVTDANYVESIVTDAGRLGFEHPVALANFYPNWGTSQPGCGIDLVGTCGHERVNALFAASISPANAFTSIRCGGGIQNIRDRNCVQNGASRQMGGDPPNDGPSPANSVFHLSTTAAHPFSLG